MNVRAGYAAKVAVGNRLGGNGRLGNHAVFLAKLGGIFNIRLHGFDRSGIFLQKRGNCFWVCFGKFSTHNNAAHRQHAVRIVILGDRVPFIRQIQGAAHIGVLHHNACNGGNGQHAHVIFTARHARHDRVRCHKFNLHISVGIFAVNAPCQPILLKQIFQHIFRVRALPGGINRLALQVGNALNRVAVFQNIQHAVGVEGANLHAAIRLVIEVRRDVGRQRRHIIFAARQPRHHVVIRAGHGKIIIIHGFACVICRHQADSADTRRPGKHGDINICSLISSTDR